MRSNAFEMSVPWLRTFVFFRLNFVDANENVPRVSEGLWQCELQHLQRVGLVYWSLLTFVLLSDVHG